MPCVSNAAKGQTEFEFFQQMSRTLSENVCCGPLTPLGFTHDSMVAFDAALTALNVPLNYLDVFDHEVIDSEHMAMTMCAKHWFKHARVIGDIGEKSSNTMWMELAYLFYRYTCATNDWDYKEILNFINTLEKSR